MKTAILYTFVGAIFFVVTGNAIAANAVHDNPSLKTSSALQRKNGDIISIADEKKDPGKEKRQANRCKRLRAECEFVHNPAKARKMCTPENVSFMNENCLGKGKK